MERLKNKIKIFLGLESDRSEDLLASKLHLIDVIDQKKDFISKHDCIKINKLIETNRLNFSSLDFLYLIGKIEPSVLVNFLINNQLSESALIDAYYNIIKEYKSNNSLLLKTVMELFISKESKHDTRGLLFKITVESLLIKNKIDFDSFFGIFFNLIGQKYINNAIYYFSINGRALNNSLENIFYFIYYSKKNKIIANWNFLYNIIEEGCLSDLNNNYFRIRMLLKDDYVYEFKLLDEYATTGIVYNQPINLYKDIMFNTFGEKFKNITDVNSFCISFFGSDQKRFKKIFFDILLSKDGLFDYNKILWCKLFASKIDNIDYKYQIVINIFNKNGYNWVINQTTYPYAYKFLDLIISNFKIEPKKMIDIFMNDPHKEKPSSFTIMDSIFLLNRISPYINQVDESDAIDIDRLNHDIKKVKNLDEIHDLLVKANQRIKTRNFKLNQDNILILNGLKMISGYTVFIPQTNNDLFDCGDNLRICIGTAGYGEIVSKSGDQRIALLKKGEEFYGAIHFSADYGVKAIVIHQSKLYRNEEMPQSLVLEFIKICEKTIF